MEECTGSIDELENFRAGLGLKRVVEWDNGKEFISVMLITYGSTGFLWWKKYHIVACDVAEIREGRDYNGSTFYNVYPRDLYPLDYYKNIPDLTRDI